MPRPKRPWFRFYVEAIHDRKLRRLVPAHRWLWVVVLAMARQSPDPGVLLMTSADGGEPLTEHDLIDAAALKPAEVRKGMREFERLGMVVNAGGVWSVSKWSERQPESDDVTKRTAKHRSKEPDGNVPTTPIGTGPSRVVAKEAEVETEQPPSPSARSPRATRLADDWRPTPEPDLVAAIGGQQAAKREFDRFVDYWRAKGGQDGRKLDWQATWRNWLRRAAESNPPRATSLPPEPGAHSRAAWENAWKETG